MSRISAEQLDKVRAWAAQGIDLNGIQKNLAAECGVHMTYMDLRFLLLDHDIEIATAPEPAPAPEPPAEEAAAPAEETPAAVQVTLDELQLPGALVSGKVLFPSGTRCSWMIDRMGSLSWIEKNGDPTPEELRAFQTELMQKLQGVM